MHDHSHHNGVSSEGLKEPSTDLNVGNEIDFCVYVHASEMGIINNGIHQYVYLLLFIPLDHWSDQPMQL